MINNEEKITKVKQQVIDICSQDHFVHHKWYVEYHLNIVEKISLQLCEKYSHADRLWVLLLVWMHDFEKIVRNGSSYQGTLGREFLEDLEFSTEDIDKLLLDIDIFERKNEIKLADASIEIKIVSSADAAAHLIGPFYNIFWWENPNMDIESLRQSNWKKLKKDWTQKVVLPEIKDAYQNHYQFFKQNMQMEIPTIK